MNLLFQDILQLQCDIGIFSRIITHNRRINIAHAFLVLPFGTDQFSDMYGSVLQIGLSHKVHSVACLRVKQIMCDHGVEQLTFHHNTVIPQLQDIILDVLPDFLYLFILEERPENLHLFLRFIPVGGDWHVVCLPFAECKGKTHQFTR